MISKISILVVLVIIAVGIEAQFISKRDDDPPLSLKIEAIDGVTYSSKILPINVVFRNTKDESIRLLDVFRDSKMKLSFFTVKITDANETPINTVGGGKISLSKDAMKYITLKREESYLVPLDLVDFLPTDGRLQPGSYSVSVTYQNQYGEDCFKGKVESNTIILTINE